MKYDMIVTLSHTKKITIDAKDETDAFNKIGDIQFEAFAKVLDAISKEELPFTLHQEIANDSVHYNISVTVEDEMDFTK